ncbi:hypothetical protein V8C26DRAFT_399342 [Trichoderma gracile]
MDPLGCACLQSSQRWQEVIRYPTDTRLPERPLRTWKYRRRARHSGGLYLRHSWLWKLMYLTTAGGSDHGASTSQLRTSPGLDTFAVRGTPKSSLLSSSRRLSQSCFDSSSLSSSPSSCDFLAPLTVSSPNTCVPCPASGRPSEGAACARFSFRKPPSSFARPRARFVSSGRVRLLESTSF